MVRVAWRDTGRLAMLSSPSSAIGVAAKKKSAKPSVS